VKNGRADNDEYGHVDKDGPGLGIDQDIQKK
jgi:hypothetical protein